MMKVSQRPKDVATSKGANPFVRVTRISFSAESAPAAEGRRRFTQPRRATALEEDVAIESIGEGAESGDHCFVVCVPEGASKQNRERARALLERSEADDVRPTITVERGPDVIEWRAGLAVVQCREGTRDDILAALVDFTFYEGNLRALERAVTAAEVQAEADIALAHRIRYQNRVHWARFTDCMEQCSRMRLTFSRLEPQLGAASRTLAPGARSWVFRLLQKSDMEDRLEALSDRLETLEDLYEAATQRISEYRWYVSGHALEIGIIVLLLIECAMMSVDIYFHVRDRHGATETSSRAVPALSAEGSVTT
jgi:hypothetical protein